MKMTKKEKNIHWSLCLYVVCALAWIGGIVWWRLTDVSTVVATIYPYPNHGHDYCPKCGQYTPRSDYCNQRTETIAQGPDGSVRILTSEEHLHHTCGGCGYEWLTHTQDWGVK